MEFKSLSDLVRIVENSLSVQFYGKSVVLRKSVLKVLAAVMGGVLYLLSLIAKRIWKNRFVSTCDVSALDGFGVEYGVPHKPPMKASGNVSVTLQAGTSSVEFPQGTVLVEPVSKIEYEVKSTVTVSSTNTYVPVMAVDYGDSCNLESGTSLSFRDDPVSGVETIASVDVTGGVLEKVEIDGDVHEWGETAENYRNRLLERVRNPPHGGAKNDYVQWATRFSFVTDAFSFSNTPKTNSVRVAVANYESESIALTGAQLDEVSAYITDDVRRNVTADVLVFNVTPVEISIEASITPYNDVVIDSVSGAIRNYLRKIAPGSTVTFDELSDVVRSNSIAKTFAITSATKGTSSVSSLSFSVDLSDDDSPVAEVAKIDAGSINLVDGNA